jgi:hypothetical protein
MLIDHAQVRNFLSEFVKQVVEVVTVDEVTKATNETNETNETINESNGHAEKPLELKKVE